jgi:uncharacterized protein YpmB
MLRRAQKAIWIALFVCLVVGFGSAVWQSSTVSPYQQAKYDANRATKGRTASIAKPESSDERIADYTWWVAAFTLCLAFVSAFQIFFLIRADQTARIMAETAQLQTTKMGEWADAAEKQMLILGRQTDIQEKQHAIGRLQFFAAHRPRLVVRGVSFADDDGLVAGKRLKIRIPIVNQGNTDATVRKVAAQTFLVSRLTEINLGGDFHEIDTSDLTPLASGTNAVVKILTDHAFGNDEIFGIEQKTRFLLCVGYVQYKDESGGLRTTGFARCLQHQSSRFTPIEDPEYEFSY